MSCLLGWSTPSLGADAVAKIGSEHVTEADVVKQAKAEFDKQQSDYELSVRQLQHKHEQARYELLQLHIEKLLDQRAIELEAKSRGTTPSTIQQDIKVPAVTDDEASAFYEERKARINQPFDKVKPQIVQYLATQHNAEASRKFYDSLRAKYGISSLLPPYRASVAAVGPARGENRAAITIVEFADFQCPFCSEVEGTLRSVLANHPDDVKLVFRNLPLPSLHPNATVAAEAGVCADRAGKFWQMHDAMFASQDKLDAAALKDTAKGLGLDLDNFAACLTDPTTQSTLEADERMAQELNVTSTPFFFVNGRPMGGSKPAEEFESIIAEELRLAGKRRTASNEGATPRS
jgi:protein-disulfide isomerase